MVRKSALLDLTVDECCPTVLDVTLSELAAEELAEGFSALADPVRLRLLNLLGAAPDGEVCICNLVGPIGRTQPTISHHMKVLARAGLVHGERRTKWVWYSIDRDRLEVLRSALSS
jgi:ArsR family transcriptional regulator, arsenate/arsenite/antimonite-responsive transcriptional repressor